MFTKPGQILLSPCCFTFNVLTICSQIYAIQMNGCLVKNKRVFPLVLQNKDTKWLVAMSKVKVTHLTGRNTKWFKYRSKQS